MESPRATSDDIGFDWGQKLSQFQNMSNVLILNYFQLSIFLISRQLNFYIAKIIGFQIASYLLSHKNICCNQLKCIVVSQQEKEE